MAGTDATDPFEHARRAYARIVAEEAAGGAISAGSVLLTHGRRTPRAFVLLHGLTSSPPQFEQFARLLYARGANVFVPRLPRHGHEDRLTNELKGLTPEELIRVAAEATTIGAGLGERVTVVGFSLGGLLSAWVGQHLSVDRIVCIAPFFGVGWLPNPLAALAGRAVLLVPNVHLWWNPIERQRHGPPHTYPRFPTHAVGRALVFANRLLANAVDEAPLTRRIAFVTNDAEATVDNVGILRLAAAWRRHAGVLVEMHRLSGLRRSHDIIEPKRRAPLIDQVYPPLLEIVAGGAPEVS
jgi:carboxylesterase